MVSMSPLFVLTSHISGALIVSILRSSLLSPQLTTARNPTTTIQNLNIVVSELVNSTNTHCLRDGSRESGERNRTSESSTSLRKKNCSKLATLHSKTSLVAVFFCIRALVEMGSWRSHRSLFDWRTLARDFVVPGRTSLIKRPCQCHVLARHAFV